MGRKTMKKSKANKTVVLAYSGGLDTSIIIPWLIENYGLEVIAYVGNVGQAEELKGLQKKALKSGAKKVIIEDLQKPLVEQFIFPTLKAGALYEGKYSLATALARPLLAKGQVDTARKLGALWLAHGCTGKGNDQVRFELAYAGLAPDLKVIAPWREWDIQTREEAMDYARQRGIPVPTTAAKPYSSDRNLWHISYEGGVLENLEQSPPESMFQLTKSPKRGPSKPQRIRIKFRSGIPISIGNKKLSGVDLIQKLNKVAGLHGIGRIDMVENRTVGMKSRGVYESPAATVLYTALNELCEVCLDKDSSRFRRNVGQEWAELAYGGLWFTPLRESLGVLVDHLMAPVSGEIELSLYKGRIEVMARRPIKGLYLEDLASFDMGSYDSRDAQGFIKLYGLPYTLAAQVRGRRSKKD